MTTAVEVSNLLVVRTHLHYTRFPALLTEPSLAHQQPLLGVLHNRDDYCTTLPSPLPLSSPPLPQVLSLYMGITVNLIEAWDPYKAAKTALNNTLEQRNVEALTERHTTKAQEHNRAVLGLLKEGTLAEDYVLDHVPRLMNTIRACNVTIRWLVLHAAPSKYL